MLGNNYGAMKTRRVMCGGVAIGGGAPITIQSMTNTDTRDVASTVRQIERLAEAGCQIVRCAVPDQEAALALGEIKKRTALPLVADIHFDYRLALASIENGADKIRINPGNIGGKDRVKAVLDAARSRGIPVRVGVNSGSLSHDVLEKYGGVTPKALAESALTTIDLVESLGFEDLVVSIKAADAALNFEAHKIAAERTDHPFHIGITESGTVESGKIKSAVGIGALLLSGIGDTLRVSLTGDPAEEVLLAREILKAAGLRKSGIDLISCPTCGRTKVDLASLARQVEEGLKPIEAQRERQGLPPLTVAVMGCEVNGPGEAREADIGVACGRDCGRIFRRGQAGEVVPQDRIVEILLEAVKNF